jgi:hypothetical protein
MLVKFLDDSFKSGMTPNIAINCMAELIAVLEEIYDNKIESIDIEFREIVGVEITGYGIYCRDKIVGFSETNKFLF